MAKQSQTQKNAPHDFLELFFPIHYTIGMTVEDTLRNELLTRQQTIILWLIRSKGENGQVMRRKDIVKAMSYWFELTNSAISKALRSLSKPPLAFIVIEEDPLSGREKIIKLTPKGKRFIGEMMTNAEALIKTLTDELSDEEVKQGLHIFRRLSDIFDAQVEQKREQPGFKIGKPSVKLRS